MDEQKPIKQSYISKVLFTITLTSSFMILLYYSAVIMELDIQPRNAVTDFSKIFFKKKPSTTNLILVYTSFFGDALFNGFSRIKDYVQSCGCSFNGCELTFDRNRYEDANVVIFHCRDMPSISDLYILKNRKVVGQLWLYLCMENPFNTPPVDFLNVYFELTATYRLNSDIYYPYKSYEKLPPTDQSQTNSLEKHINYAEGKTKQIAWMVSHCDTRRDLLAHKFEALGLSIEVGGECAKYFKKQFYCEEKNCKNELQYYKFYFSAENNLCKDYITEKYWSNPFNMNAIPITLGGSNYSDPRLAIPGSFINALDFNSPKELVDYIKLVDSNDTLYNEYFEWKKFYKFYEERTSGCSIQLCQLCDKLKKGIKVQRNALIFNINLERECDGPENYFDHWIKR